MPVYFKLRSVSSNPPVQVVQCDKDAQDRKQGGNQGRFFAVVGIDLYARVDEKSYNQGHFESNAQKLADVPVFLGLPGIRGVCFLGQLPGVFRVRGFRIL